MQPKMPCAAGWTCVMPSARATIDKISRLLGPLSCPEYEGHHASASQDRIWNCFHSQPWLPWAKMCVHQGQSRRGSSLQASGSYDTELTSSA